MNDKQEWEETTNTFISLILGKEDAEKFGDVKKSVTVIRQGDKYWQAPTAIGITASVLFSYTLEEGDNSTLCNIVDFSLEPLEAFLEQITPQPGQITDAETDRLLLHTRFGLGLLLLIKSRLKEDLDLEEKADSILHTMASTQLSWKDLTLREGPGIVKYYPDMGQAKVFAALYVPMICPYLESEKYDEIIFLISEALPYAEYWHNALIRESCEILDGWAAKCEELDNEKAFDFPAFEWLDLFAAAAYILSVCEDIDSSGNLPHECRKESAQYLAWKFGNLVGKLAVSGSRWQDDPFKHFREFSDAVIDQSFTFSRGHEQTAHALKRVLALLTDYNKTRDYNAARDQYINLWRWSDSYRGMSLDEIGPHTDLYWAMKIGFVDNLCVVSPVPYDSEVLGINRDTEIIKNILTTIALRQLKSEGNLEQVLRSLPANKKDVYLRLEHQLHVIWKELPGKVANALAKAEQYFDTGVNDDDAKVWFCKAVEASLNHCFVTPFCEFVYQRDKGQVMLLFPPPRGAQRMSAAKVKKLSLGEWGSIFNNLTNASPRSLDSLGTKDLVAFVKSHLHVSGLPDLAPLAILLSRCQEFRAGSAHYQEAISRYDKERQELELLRDTVLGIGQPSIIVEIFRRLAAPS